MKLTKHQQDVARTLKAGTLIPITWGGIKYKGRALRIETEIALRHHFGNNLVQITTKGKRVNSDWLTLREHVAEINEVKPITRVETHLRFHTEFSGQP